MSTPDLPVSLALFDAVPVALSAVGMFGIARYVRKTRPERATEALIGAALVVGGGATKVLWKTLVAFDIADLEWMSGLLFMLLAPGFVLLASSLTRHRVLVAGLVLPLGSGGALRADGLPSLIELVLLVVTVVASTVLLVLLAREASRLGVPVAPGAFWAALAVFWSLGPLAVSAEQSVSIQWAEEILNSVAQVLIIVGITRLSAGALDPVEVSDSGPVEASAS